MFNVELAWLFSAGFYFTLGIAFAIGLIRVLWNIISKLVDLVWPDPLPLLKSPPPHIKDLTVRREGKCIVASCTAFGVLYSHVEPVTPHDSVKAAAAAAQIELITKVASDHDGSEHY